MRPFTHMRMSLDGSPAVRGVVASWQRRERQTRNSAAVLCRPRAVGSPLPQGQMRQSNAISPWRSCGAPSLPHQWTGQRRSLPHQSPRAAGSSLPHRTPRAMGPSVPHQYARAGGSSLPHGVDSSTRPRRAGASLRDAGRGPWRRREGGRGGGTTQQIVKRNVAASAVVTKPAISVQDLHVSFGDKQVRHLCVTSEGVSHLILMWRASRPAFWAWILLGFAAGMDLRLCSVAWPQVYGEQVILEASQTKQRFCLEVPVEDFNKRFMLKPR
jgi:hypothetical protein